MCLGTKLSDRSLARYKVKGKKCGYIRVWKVVGCCARKYWPLVFDDDPFCNGLNCAYIDAGDEDELCHAYKSKSQCVKAGWDGRLISCLVKPEWIKAISLETLTTKAIVMPKYPKTKVTVAEFRAAIKGKKVKKYSWE